MNVPDEKTHPWLVAEKFVRRPSIKGWLCWVCLGAQLIADVMGARIFPNEFKEVLVATGGGLRG